MTEVADLVDAIVDQDFATAAPMFKDILGTRMNDALDQEKINVADQMFNGAEAELDDDDPDVEDIEAAIDELDDDDEDQYEMDFEEDDEQ